MDEFGGMWRARSVSGGVGLVGSRRCSGATSFPVASEFGLQISS